MHALQEGWGSQVRRVLPSSGHLTQVHQALLPAHFSALQAHHLQVSGKQETSLAIQRHGQHTQGGKSQETAWLTLENGSGTIANWLPDCSRIGRLATGHK